MTEIRAYPAGTPVWTDLTTSDPEGARTFYAALLGWDFDIGGPAIGGYTYCLASGKRAAGMIPAGKAKTVWTTYLASDDVDATAAAFTSAGASIMIGPVNAGPAGRVVVGRDPTGAVIGAWEGREHVGAQIVNETGSVVWNELQTPDLDAAAAFYSDVFGYTWDEGQAGDGDPGYRTFSAGGHLAGGALQLTDAEASGAGAFWMTYFGVADTDAAVASVARLGGACVGQPVDSPFGRRAVLRDPQGAVFSIIDTTGE